MLAEFYFKFSKVFEVTDSQSICGKNVHLLNEANYYKLCHEIGLNDLISSISRYYVLHRIIRQMRSGFAFFGLAEALNQYSDLFKVFLTDGLRPPLTAG